VKKTYHQVKIELDERRLLEFHQVLLSIFAIKIKRKYEEQDFFIKFSERNWKTDSV